ncbi:hypothetical protein AAC387_Pa01g0576 [Persea americana]
MNVLLRESVKVNHMHEISYAPLRERRPSFIKGGLPSSGWNNPDGIKCAMETTPVLNMSMTLDVGTDWQMYAIAANVTRSTKVPIYFLNITTLSEYRKDAHASVYTIRQGKMLTPKQKADPLTYVDCIHWCLPVECWGPAAGSIALLQVLLLPFLLLCFL